MAAQINMKLLCSELASTFFSAGLLSSPPSLPRTVPLGSSPPGLHYNGLHRSQMEFSSASFMGQKGGFCCFESTGVGAAARGRREERVVAAASLGGFLGGLFKGPDAGEATRQQFASSVAMVNSLENEMKLLSDEQLRGKTAEFKQRILSGEALDSILPEAFAVVREASDRVLALRPFDVQLIGGMVLHSGQIAEMKTGEGKTLVAVLSAYLNALSGKGVHVVTVNDYLARRDCEWVGQIHRFLGLTVGLIQGDMNQIQRKESYSSDVTYVTNSEIGFDFLRDNLATSKDELVLRGFNYCVIDEVDSILIDEARTPLIISGPAEKPSERYFKTAKMASVFARDVHYTVDEKQKSVLLTEEGYEAAEEILNVTDLYDPREQWASYVLNAIKAKELFLKDINYIVRGKEVVIVDEFTGRIMQGRRWSDGLHQAIEAKEGVPIQPENVTLASISYQNFFLQYSKLCGMTGTAATESVELESIYKLTVAVVPTNRTMVRKDESDVVFRLVTGKWRAVVVEISRMVKSGRPVLVGTTSVEQSEMLSSQLQEAAIPHQVLNAKPENAEREAEIIAQSGRLGTVTLATNMAGRGTDIILGGNAEFMAKLKLREIIMPRLVKISDDEIPFQKRRKLPPRKTWKANETLFPCELSHTTISLAKDAVNAAVQAWGEKSLSELEAENQLSYACEKGPTENDVVARLRGAFEAVLSEYKPYAEDEKKQVISAGGLHVIGTERHESRRIDNQLRGRSGRQGDPGSSRFFLSLEDTIFRIFGGDKIKGLMTAFRVGDLPIESKMLTRSLDEAQKKVETYFFEMRKQLYEYDEVLNSQRDRVYTERRRALESTDLQNQIIEYAELTMNDIVNANIDPNIPREEWNWDALVAKVRQYCYLLSDLTPQLLSEQCATTDNLKEYLHERGREAYLQKRGETEKLAPGLMSEAERYFVLSQTDKLWKDHLEALRFVQQAVSLRGYAQRDPLIEYKLEAYNLFLDMMAQIRRNVIYSVYQFKPVIMERNIDTTANGNEKVSKKGLKAKPANTKTNGVSGNVLTLPLEDGSNEIIPTSAAGR